MKQIIRGKIANIIIGNIKRQQENIIENSRFLFYVFPIELEQLSCPI